MPKSILLIGFPRGFTSTTYELIARATGLRTAAATSGEVLNGARWTRAGAPVPPELAGLAGSQFYDRKAENYDAFAAVLKRHAGGEAPWLIKDVVQPFHVLEYLRRNPEDFQVFFVRRELGEVISRMRRRGWGYVHSLDELEQRMLRYPVIDTRRVMFDEGYLFRRLRGFGLDVRDFPYLTAKFTARRDATLDEIEQDLAPAAPPAPAEFPPIEAGRAYRFGTGPGEVPNRVFLASGWEPIPGKGFWSDGDLASLAFTAPPLPAGGVLKVQVTTYPGLDNAVTLQLRLDGAAEIVVRGNMAEPQRRFALHLPAAAQPRQAWLRIRPVRTVVPARVSRQGVLAACGVAINSLVLSPAADGAAGGTAG